MNDYRNLRDITEDLIAATRKVEDLLDVATKNSEEWQDVVSKSAEAEASIQWLYDGIINAFRELGSDIKADPDLYEAMKDVPEWQQVNNDTD